MLDPRFKTFCFMSPFIDHEQGKDIVKEYEIFFLFPMLLKCHYHMHHLAEFERGNVDQGVEKDINLDIFEMTTNIIEPTMKLINNKALLIFKCY